MISPLRAGCQLEAVEGTVIGVVDDPAVRLTSDLTVDEAYQVISPGGSVDRRKAEGPLVEVSVT